ncbi:unnamed protein product [Vicia faba]|uniref:Uncharacterized protein n=1 Tax=Vicia faba TaxID=3906 RepID=A0AAV0ZS62_VICFA|nr:unnamed protein product [Vicia faba]
MMRLKTMIRLKSCDLQEISRIRSGKRQNDEATLSASKKSTKGPLDAKSYQKKGKTLRKRKKQSRIKDGYGKEAIGRTFEYIAQCFYRNGIPFNVAKSKSLKLMVEAISNHGTHLKPPRVESSNA